MTGSSADLRPGERGARLLRGKPPAPPSQDKTKGRYER
jgi:hypothetical protein